MKKSKYWHFSKGVNPSFFSKMAIFPPFFYGNIGQENVFCDILEPKNAFLGYKNNKFKTSRNWHFSKGVSPWFCSKNFSNFFFLAILARKMYFTIFLKEKTPFYAIKTKCWKSRKIHIFPKGLTPCFWCTNGQFYAFFFWQYRPGKCLLQYGYF